MDKPATQKKPIKKTLDSGKYYWCACGLSQKDPFCDGSHKQCPDGPRSCPFSLETESQVLLCGCKQTKTPPYCDGSHTRL